MGRPCKYNEVGPGPWGQDLGPFPRSVDELMSEIQRICMRISDSAAKIEPNPRPVCRMFDRCEDCPYPAHGFICWGPDKGYLRSEMQKLYAKKKEMADIKDFINLTFCCQQATVISDFSDLEAVGCRHYMNLNGGCASREELENLDGHETALLLIDSGAGVVTPYGVVYDNGMKLEQAYDGRHLPGYLYEPSVLALEAASAQNRVTGVLCLPASDRQLQRLRLRAEIDSPDTWIERVAGLSAPAVSRREPDQAQRDERPLCPGGGGEHGDADIHR